MIRCPKCGSIEIKKIGNTHYICNNQNCINNKKPIQFKVEYDNKKIFPYNFIFPNRDIKEFYKLPYFNSPSVGDE